MSRCCSSIRIRTCLCLSARTSSRSRTPKATKWVIGFSAMGAKASGFMNRNVSNAGYMIGTWTPGEAFQPETEFRLSVTATTIAPQSFNDGERQIVYGWMSPFVEPIPMQDDGWCGNLTLPREITLGADGDLHTAPVSY